MLGPIADFIVEIHDEAGPQDGRHESSKSSLASDIVVCHRFQGRGRRQKIGQHMLEHPNK
jgi:hypothetical protein